MRKHPLRQLLVGIILGGAACSAALGYQYPASPQRAAQDFIALRQKLNAVVDPSPITLASQMGSLSGKALDLNGEIVASTCAQSQGQRSFGYLLQTPAGVAIMIKCPEELNGLRVGDAVRVIVQAPQEACGLDPMEFRGIVRVADLPPELQPGYVLPAPVTSTPAPAPIAGPTQPVASSGGSQPAASGPQWRPGMQLPASGDASYSGNVTFQNISGSAPAQWMSQQDIERWKSWVKNHNGKLADWQAELIVRCMVHYSRVYGLDHRLCFAVAQAESDFNPNCVSHAGAMGIMQLMPSGLSGLGVKDPWNVAENIRGGILELSQCIYKFADHSNYEQTALGLAGYNAGLGAVKKYGGVPPYNETQNYIKKVTNRFLQLCNDGFP